MSLNHANQVKLNRIAAMQFRFPDMKLANEFWRVD
jgi:hypothetical protein